MARPNYAGRVLDKLVLIVAGQTDRIRENPDESGYPAKRGGVLETTAWAMWEARNRLQARRRLAKTTKG